MDKELRILIVDDSAVDAELVARELERGGLVHTSKWVKSKDEFIEAFGEYAPGIILCDYNMSDFRAPEALEITKKSSREIPFIVISGTIGEDTAVEVMKSGAVDYIMKDRLVRLVPAIRRAIEEARIFAESRRLESELNKEREAQFRALIENLPGKVFVKDRDSVYISCNENYSKDMKLTPKEVVGKTDYDFFPTYLAEKYRTDDKRVMESGKTENLEEEYVVIGDYLNKERRAVINTVKVPVRDNEGHVTGICGFFWDITERKQAELEREILLKRQRDVNALQQLLLAPATLENKLKVITDGIVRIFDADFCRIWLIKPGDLCDQGCIHAQVKEGPHECRYRDKCLHLLTSSGRYTHTDGKGHARVPFGCYKVGLVASGQEHKFLTNDVANDPHVPNHEWARELGLVSFAGYQIRIPEGEIIGVLALFSKKPVEPHEDALIDNLSTTTAFVVQQVAASEETIQARSMKTASEIKSDFTSMVSHELRTPLASLKEAISIVLDGVMGEVNEKQKEILEIANNNLTRLSRFINHVLDFQKLEAGKMEFRIEDDDINALVKEVRDTMFPSVQKKGLDFMLQLDENLPKIKFDHDRIVDVLLNVVNNSVKFTETGSITMATKLGGNFIQISSRIPGIGIKKENMKRLFQQFEQLERKAGGTGLGLAIAQKTIAAHGGKMWAESTFGQGTTMHFILPVQEHRG